MRIITTVFLLLALLSAGCGRKGCTDKDAVNYDKKAKRTDNSCKYEGLVVFWWNKTTAAKLKTQGISNVELFINGASIGSLSTSSSWDTPPECGEANTVSYTMDLGSLRTKTCELIGKDQFGFPQYNEDFVFKAHTCTAQELGL
jgi:hypothetical protein